MDGGNRAAQLRDEDLHGLVDGTLSDSRRAEVEALLAQHPEEAEKVRAYRQIDAGLRALYDPVLKEAVPARLLKRPSVWRRSWTQAAMAAGLVALGVAGGWFGRGALAPAPPAATLARQAAVAHVVYAPEVRHPVEVGADDEDHLVRWLSKRLGTELRCPRLAKFGFDLVGGRLLAGPSGPVAHFMYQDKKGTRLTLYVTSQRDTGQTAFRYSQEAGVSVFYWIEGRYGYALSGELPRETLLTIAHAAHKELSP
jgi:anti-sigma factor RsiW